MKKQMVLFVVLLVLGFCAAGYAAQDAPADGVVTLEQAKALALANSLNFAKHEIGVQRRNVQLEQLKAGHSNIVDQYDSLTAQYHALYQQYWHWYSLYESVADSVYLDQMNAVWVHISKVEKDMEAQSKKIGSSESNIKNAETNYADAIKAKADFEKQLQFDVDQLYVAILNQEAALSIANMEYKRELALLDVEKVRLHLGRSSRQQVDQLADHVVGFERKIMEQTEPVKTRKRQLNDLMGRGYDDELKLISFELAETAETFDYDHLLSKALQQNRGLEKIRRELAQHRDELNDLDRDDDYYEYQLKAIDIEEKKLQLADEEKKLKERIGNLITDLEAKQYAYHLSLISYENAQKALQWEQKRFEMGLISKLTLRQSELNCLNAQNRKNVAGYAFYLAEATIRLAEEGIL